MPLCIVKKPKYKLNRSDGRWEEAERRNANVFLLLLLLQKNRLLSRVDARALEIHSWICLLVGVATLRGTRDAQPSLVSLAA